METTITMTGKNRDGVPTASMNLGFEVTVEAAGHRREDGMTAAQVRQERRDRKVTDGPRRHDEGFAACCDRR